MTPEECRSLRCARGLTPTALAVLAGLAERTVIRFEARTVRARAGTVIALRKALRTAP